jgi:hypothetical protein
MSQTDTSEGPVIVQHNGNGKAVEDRAVVPSFPELISQALAHGNIDAMERLMTLYERAKAHECEITAKRAFVQMHHEMPQIEKKGKVDSTTQRGANIKYGYATLEDIDEVARPIMTKHGFGLTFRPVEQTADYIIVEGELMHENGWSFTARKQEPIDKNAHMGLQQKGGAAQTFAIRYLTVALLNIVVKGEDTDGHNRDRKETGPVSPPPSEKSMGNAWAKSVEGRLKQAGDLWWSALADSFAEAATSEDLEALIDLVRDNVNTLDKGKQKTIGAHLMKARARLSAVAPERFDFPVKDASGDTDGELFSDVSVWVKEFKEFWNSATGADDRDNLLHHNADALAVARRTNKPLLKAIDEWRRETSAEEPVVPFLAETVRPPMNNGRPSWEGWLGAIQQELFAAGTDEDLTAFIEAQKPIMPDVEILPRQMAINAIAKACEGRVAKPDWLRELILPITAAANNREWAEARMAELHWITDKETFGAAVKAAIPRMKIIQKEDLAIYDRVKAVFTAKQGTLP